MKKIITHDGLYHADELVAIALLKRTFGIVEIIRARNIAQEDIDDPETFLVDVGKMYDEISNFDHHQDKNLEASNMLIARFLVKQGMLSGLVFEKMMPFLVFISNIDRGIMPNGGPPSCLNSIIRNLTLSGTTFEAALAIVSVIVGSVITVAEKAVADEERWFVLPLLFSGKVRESMEGGIITGWHELANAEGVQFLLSVNKQGGYSIISADPTRFPIPESETQLFLHNAKFLATYQTREDAIQTLLQVFGE